MSTAVAKREPAEMAEQQDSQVEAIKRILSQQTPSSEIRTRVGRGGMKLKYTDGAYVIRTLNAAFGWDWDFVADSEELLTNNGKPFEVKVRGSLTVRLAGRTITKTQYGCQPIEMLKSGEAPVSIGDAYKGAATDAMKKCASLLGIALDLYDSDFKAEKYADANEAEPEPTPRPATMQRPAPQPERQQPTRAQMQYADGTTRTISALLGFLKWDANALAQEIYNRFQLGVSDTDTGLALEALSSAQKKELLQALEAEKQARTGGRR